MADAYMVTVEADDDATLWDNPVLFDTEDEARKFAATIGTRPEGYSVVLYRAEIIETIEPA